MRWRHGLSICLAAGSIVALASAAGSYETEVERQSDVALEICGHTEEMVAAREALEQGERARALDHLKTARRLLIECAQRVQDDRSEERPVETI